MIPIGETCNRESRTPSYMLCDSVDMWYLYVMLSLGYVLCDVYVMKAWNTPGTKGDSAQLYYLDKIAVRQSTLVLAIK